VQTVTVGVVVTTVLRTTTTDGAISAATCRASCFER
jgi:hypothetical protein